MSKFNEQIKAFNTMYGMPAPQVPVISRVTFPDRLDLVERLAKFKLILLEELDEVHELQVSINRGASEIEVLTELADWLGDLQVYCASEMAKFGLDNEAVLSLIMASNMSKLGEDGKPIYDERGKVCKGPGYWKPEPAIKKYIEVARNS
jgi:NTP pyrophosphatase (non-canonical NTP hydrolase)